MKKKTTPKKTKSSPLEQKKRSPTIKQETGNKKRFDQLLDDAVLGVKKK